MIDTWLNKQEKILKEVDQLIKIINTSSRDIDIKENINISNLPPPTWVYFGSIFI